MLSNKAKFLLKTNLQSHVKSRPGGETLNQHWFDNWELIRFVCYQCESFCPPISPGLWQNHCHSSLQTMPHDILSSIMLSQRFYLSPRHTSHQITSLCSQQVHACPLRAAWCQPWKHQLPFHCHLPMSATLSWFYSMSPCKCWLVVWGLLAGKWQQKERKQGCELHDLTDFTLYRLPDFNFCCPMLS